MDWDVSLFQTFVTIVIKRIQACMFFLCAHPLFEFVSDFWLRLGALFLLVFLSLRTAKSSRLFAMLGGIFISKSLVFVTPSPLRRQRRQQQHLSTLPENHVAWLSANKCPSFPNSDELVLVDFFVNWLLFVKSCIGLGIKGPSEPFIIYF